MITAVHFNVNRTDLSLTTKIFLFGIIASDTISIILLYS